MHLTNYSINKTSSKFIKNTQNSDFEGHKRSYQSILDYMKANNEDIGKIHPIFITFRPAARRYRSINSENHMLCPTNFGTYLS
jgi:hypothetical protein